MEIKHERSATKRAIHNLGGPTRAAEQLGVTRGRIYQWFDEGYPEPRAYQIAALSGVPVEDLLKEVTARDAQ